LIPITGLPLRLKYAAKGEKMRLPDIGIQPKARAAAWLAAAAVCAVVSGCGANNYPLYASPTNLVFKTAVGTSTTAQVTFYGAATMTGVTLGGPFPQLFSVPQGACEGVKTEATGNGCTVTITFKPTTTGAFAATLTGNSTNGSAIVDITSTATAAAEMPADDR
jgi:trimeric autotransporter adhesin